MTLERVKLESRFESKAVLLAIGTKAHLEIKELLGEMTETDYRLLEEAKEVLELDEAMRTKRYEDMKKGL